VSSINPVRRPVYPAYRLPAGRQGRQVIGRAFACHSDFYCGKRGKSAMWQHDLISIFFLRYN
jgi:hypothetical protein